MEPKANHILIGAFLLLSTLAGFAFLFWIQNYGSGTSSSRYYILFKGPVTGLSPASTVLFNGLKVGKIEDFAIDPKNPAHTKVLVTIRKDIPVRSNSYARIISQGLSAYSSVMITPGTIDAGLLVVSEEGALPVISAAPGNGSSSLFEAAPAVLNKADTVLQRVDELIANNEKLVRDTLKNVESFTRELERNKSRIAGLMDNADKVLVSANDAAQTAGDAAKAAGETAQKLNKIVDENEQKITAIIQSIAATSKNTQIFTAMLADKQADIATIIENVRDMSEQFKGVAGKLEATLDGLSGFLSNEDGTSMMVEITTAATSFKNLAEKLDRSIGDSSEGMARFAKNGLREFEGLMREGRRMVKAMERVMNKIERNPQGLIFGAKSVREYKSN